MNEMHHSTGQFYGSNENAPLHSMKCTTPRVNFTVVIQLDFRRVLITQVKKSSVIVINLSSLQNNLLFIIFSKLD